jgi:hypothetical protein
MIFFAVKQGGGKNKNVDVVIVDMHSNQDLLLR